MIPKFINYLIVEDLVSDSVLIQRQFKKLSDSPEIRFVDSRLALNNALKGFMPDIVVTDFNLDGLDAFDVINIVKDVNSLIPVIVITGNVKNESIIDDLLKAGADGFFYKDPMSTLHERLTPLFLKIFDERKQNLKIISDQRRSKESIRELADYDRAFGREEKDERDIFDKVVDFFSRRNRNA